VRRALKELAVGLWRGHGRRITVREDEVCWFCGQTADKYRACEVVLRKRLSSYLRSLVGIRWAVQRIRVPRCASCQKKHRTCKILEATAFVMGFVLVVAFGVVAPAIFARLPDWVTTNSLPSMITLMMLLLTLFLGPFLLARFGLSRPVLRGARHENDIGDYPEIKPLRSDGWKVGEPRGGQIE
jgi:hypothetical protein